MSIPSKQDYRSIDTAPLSTFEPTLSLTVVVPARDTGDGQAQAKLDLVLTSLAAQSYPSDLLEVVVVDDGSPTALTLPARRPARTRLVSLADDGPAWGKSRAVNTALAEVTTDLVMSLDADMLLHPDHLRAMARWVHASPAAVVLGYKRLVPAWQSDPDVVASLLTAGEWDAIADGASEPHSYFEDLVDSTDQLAGADLGVFRALVGASVMLRTDLMQASGGYDPHMRLAEDTELGYRLVQRGAVLIPEKQAQAWHLGLTSMTQHRETILAHNQALLAPRVPLLDYLRRTDPGRAWLVPTLHVNVHVEETTADHARALVGHLLAGRLGTDCTVTLVGQWPADTRYGAISDDQPRMRALASWVAGDARVSITSRPHEDVFPTPYLATVPATIPVSALRTMLTRMTAGNHGVVAAAGEQVAPASIAVWSMAALARSRMSGPVSLADPLAAARSVAVSWDAWWLDAATLGLAAPLTATEASLAQPAGSPTRNYARAAWHSWESAGFSPEAGRAIVTGLARGARRRARRVVKRRLASLAARV